MRFVTISSVAVAAAFFCATTAVAGQHGHTVTPQVHASAPHATTQTTHGSSAAHATAPTSHGNAGTHATATSHGTSTHANASTTHASTTHASKVTTQTTHTSSSRATSTHASSKVATTTTGTGTTTGTASSPIATKIESHPQLASKLTAMLPKNMTLQQAAAGFRNQGQFVAALHVSQNLGIPFAELKKEMVTNHNSLGQSIQKLRPGTDAETEAEHGEIEADHDLGTTTTGGRTSGTTTGSSTGTTGTTTGTTATTTPTTKHGKKHR